MNIFHFICGILNLKFQFWCSCRFILLPIVVNSWQCVIIFKYSITPQTTTLILLLCASSKIFVLAKFWSMHIILPSDVQNLSICSGTGVLNLILIKCPKCITPFTFCDLLALSGHFNESSTST